MFRMKSFVLQVMNLPPAADIERLIEENPGFTRDSIGDTEFYVSAFQRNGYTERFVTPLPDGFLIETIHFHRKLDRAVIDAKTKQALDAAEKSGMPITNDFEEKVKADVTAAALPYMPVETTSGRIMYHAPSGLAFITASKESATKAVKRTLATLFKRNSYRGIRSNELKSVLASRLRQHVNGITESFGPFDLTGSVAIKLPGDHSGALTLKNMHIPCGRDSHRLSDALGDGNVEKIGLRYRNLYTFTLKPGFKFSAVASELDDEGGDIPLKDVHSQENIQAIDEIYIDEAAATMTIYVDMVQQLALSLRIDIPEKDSAYSELKAHFGDETVAEEHSIDEEEAA